LLHTVLSKSLLYEIIKIRMKIAGPERYKLCFDADKFAGTGTPKFSGLATRKPPKFYVVSLENRLRVPKTPSDLKIHKTRELRNALLHT
jgi:hypothetical protein